MSSQPTVTLDKFQALKTLGASLDLALKLDAIQVGGTLPVGQFLV